MHAADRRSSTSATRESDIAAFVQLGHVLDLVGSSIPWPGHGCGLIEQEFQGLEGAVLRARALNGWFTEDNVRHMLRSLATMLRADELHTWLGAYPERVSQPRTVGLITAGNIPLVGLHDLLCVLLAGHAARVKPSSDDAALTAAVVGALGSLSPDLAARIVLADQKLGAVDAVVATGSNNTARYFEHYFGHIPRIIRKNRTSVAVLDGNESAEELALLGEDLFRYFGLGCRNVGKIFIPENFDLNRVFAAILPWAHIGQHNKWANNYDYHKAIWLMDRVPLLENGFVLFKEDAGLHSPLGSIFYERYSDGSELSVRLGELSGDIQCIVGHGHVPFGAAQCPGLADYADGVDTMAFLASLR